MLKLIRNPWVVVSFLLILVPILSFFLWPVFVGPIGIAILLFSLGTAVFQIIRKHSKTSLQEKSSRMRRVVKMAGDILALLLIVGVASHVGGSAGAWVGTRTGLWAGLAVGMVVGFAIAWSVRWGWGKVVTKT